MAEKAKKLTQDKVMTRDAAESILKERDDYRTLYELSKTAGEELRVQNLAAEAHIKLLEARSEKPRIYPAAFFAVTVLFAALIIIVCGLVQRDVIRALVADGGKTRDLMLKQLGVMDGGGVQWKWNEPNPNATTASPIVAGSSRTGWPPAGASSLPIPHPAKHTLEWFTTTPCWVRVTEITPQAKVLLEGSYRAGYSSVSRFDEQATVEVRSGCPGYVDYRINGAEVVPENVSKRPKDSEVVELLI